MSQSEEKWLESARRLDEEALGEIYDAYSPELFRYAYRLVGNVDLAEDLLSETFLRLLRALHVGGGPKSHLRAYLYRTLHNLVVDRYRRSEPPWDELLPEQVPHLEDSNPAARVEQQSEQQEARAYVWQLTPEQRQVIMLKYFQELGNDEIAAVLDKSIEAVKALQHRGLARLRRLIGERQAKQR